MDIVPSDADRIVGLYERHAQAWDCERGGDLISEQTWMARFVALLRPGAALLDLGCGSGQPIARHLIEHGFHLAGIDSSATLIALCGERFPAHEWRVADMRTLALHRTFQGLLAWDSFFHLPPDQQRRMFSIFREHAAAGAALMFTSGPRHGAAIGSLCGERLYHASLAPAEYRELLAAHGFRVMAHRAEDALCGRHTVWLAQEAVAKE